MGHDYPNYRSRGDDASQKSPQSHLTPGAAAGTGSQAELRARRVLHTIIFVGKSCHCLSRRLPHASCRAGGSALVQLCNLRRPRALLPASSHTNPMQLLGAAQQPPSRSPPGPAGPGKRVPGPCQALAAAVSNSLSRPHEPNTAMATLGRSKDLGTGSHTSKTPPPALSVTSKAQLRHQSAAHKIESYVEL